MDSQLETMFMNTKIDNSISLKVEPDYILKNNHIYKYENNTLFKNNIPIITEVIGMPLIISEFHFPVIYTDMRYLYVKDNYIEDIDSFNIFIFNGKIYVYCERGETSFIINDRCNIIDKGFDEIMMISNHKGVVQEGIFHYFILRDNQIFDSQMKRIAVGSDIVRFKNYYGIKYKNNHIGILNSEYGKIFTKSFRNEIKLESDDNFLYVKSGKQIFIFTIEGMKFKQLYEINFEEDFTDFSIICTGDENFIVYLNEEIMYTFKKNKEESKKPNQVVSTPKTTNRDESRESVENLIKSHFNKLENKLFTYLYAIKDGKSEELLTKYTDEGNLKKIFKHHKKFFKKSKFFLYFIENVKISSLYTLNDKKLFLLVNYCYQFRNKSVFNDVFLKAVFSLIIPMNLNKSRFEKYKVIVEYFYKHMDGCLKSIIGVVKMQLYRIELNN